LTPRDRKAAFVISDIENENIGSSLRASAKFPTVIARLDPPAGPKPLRRGEGPATQYSSGLSTDDRLWNTGSPAFAGDDEYVFEWGVRRLLQPEAETIDAPDTLGH
jgi:hypothetical protein